MPGPGSAAAAKKWRGQINIHELVDAAGTLTAAAPSIRACTRPYCVVRMLNQLRRGHRAWPCSS